MTAEDAINVFKEQFCGLDAYCEIHRDGLCLTDGCEVWWAIKALEQCKADVVKVVRCADCKHADAYYHCDYSAVWNSRNDYCCHGERKDG